jgi:hypothetical protein
MAAALATTVAIVAGGWVEPRPLAAASAAHWPHAGNHRHATSQSPHSSPTSNKTPSPTPGKPSSKTPGKPSSKTPGKPSSSTSETPANPSVKTAAIPAYWFPDSTNAASTDEVLDTSGGEVAFIIADTTTGPGSSVTSTWLSAIKTYESHGIEVFGYVDTDYADRSLSSVETDVSRWYSWYGVDGIFFDEAATDPALAVPGAYYNELYVFVKDMTGTGVLGTTVVLNPGTVPDEGYMTDADIVCTYEGTEASYAAATFPAWIDDYPASRFWNIVYASAGVSQMEDDISLAGARNAGYVFVTTLGGSNPYGAMPSSTFWNAELSVAR